MSHFSLIVIGDDYENQLEPFWELDLSEEELKNDPRSIFEIKVPAAEVPERAKRYIEEVEENIQRWQKQIMELDPTTEKHRDAHIELDRQKQLLTDYQYLYEQGGYGKIITDWDGYDPDEYGNYGRYRNPNAKWDWYQMGGRWAKFFKLKDGTPGLVGPNGTIVTNGWADQARVGDIDWEGMMEEAEREANQEYDKFEEVTKGLTPPERWLDFLEGCGGINNIDHARVAYGGHSWIRALRQAHLDPFLGDAQDYYKIDKGGRGAFVRCKTQGVIAPFAILKDGEWYEKGEMGWWGIVSDEKAEDKWIDEACTLLMSLPEDTLLTLVDCHI